MTHPFELPATAHRSTTRLTTGSSDAKGSKRVRGQEQQTAGKRHKGHVNARSGRSGPVETDSTAAAHDLISTE